MELTTLLGMFFDRSHTFITVPVFLLLAFVVYIRTSKAKVPDNLPWIGKESGQLFADTRATFAAFNNGRRWLHEGYDKYLLKGKSYILPDFGGYPEVIIPRQRLRWLLDFPDNVASVGEAHYDQLQGDYSFTDPHVLKTLYHEHVVHKSLARNMQVLIPDIWDEVAHSVDDTWGTDTTEWKQICVFDNMMQVIARISNRMFVGLPLCRDPAYTKAMGNFAQSVISGMTLLSFVPKLLHPILGPLITLPNQYSWRQSTKFTIPLIIARKAALEQQARDPDTKYTAPNDYVTWHLRLAALEGKTLEADPVMVSRFLMPLNFAAIHTTVFTIVNTVFDILGSDPSLGHLAGIIDEVNTVYNSTTPNEVGCRWSKASLARLVRTDSAIRESMRVSNFATRGVVRKIISPDGITDDEEGWTAPRGAYVGTDVHSVHHDPDIYPDPEAYDAFRFSRGVEANVQKRERGEEIEDGEVLKGKNGGIVATSDVFLPFGHGRHACPGRFFVALELKMLIAYIVLNYDIKHLPSRPQNTWFGALVIPDMKGTISVRRKPGTVPT